MAQSGVIADFVIWDGGLADDYLEQRGDLLPVDERELLEDILRSPRALWEVVEVDRGQGMTFATPRRATPSRWSSTRRPARLRSANCS